MIMIISIGYMDGEKIEKQEWKEKKVSLGNAIIIGAVLAVVGVIVGANWKSWFGGFSQYLGFEKINLHQMLILQVFFHAIYDR